ncbi:MAG: methyl-accepting chemotaxis protein [Betaproteobacteria bacterium]|nr:methyl-accepting chemotaxis protein [Betaproteobacteria bacterium]
MVALDSLSIRLRMLLMVGIGAGFGLLLLLTALFSFSAFRDDIRQVSGEVAGASQALTLVSGAQSALQAQQRGLNSMLLRSFMAAEFDKGKAEFLAGRNLFWQQLDALEELEKRAASRDGERIGEIRKLATELNQLYDQVLAENEPGMPKYALMVDAAIRDADAPLVNALAGLFTAISDASAQSARHASELADARYGENVFSIALVGVVGTIISLAFAAWSSRHILRRLGGELEPVVMATTRVAAGDLTQSMDAGKAAADSLVASVERMQDKLRVLIGDVKSGAEVTSANALALRRSAHEVASTTSMQSDAAATITAAIQELTTAIAAMAESAGSAADAARKTRQTANESGVVIHQAIGEIGQISEQASASANSMRDLQEHTVEISRFAREIKEISEQTNLLSLNAAIEAARAGEAGRGFAVVADEVRKLANHTSETTFKIERLVTRLGDAASQTSEAVAATAERAQRGTRLASATEAAIQKIEAICEQSAVAANEIVEVLGEQRLAAEQIAQNTERMAQMIERGAKAAGESSASAEEVALLAARLHDSTLQFSV